MINTPKFNPKEGHRIVSAGRVRVRVSAGKQESSVSISYSNDSPYRFNHHCSIYKVAVKGEEEKVGEEIRKWLIQACKKSDNVGGMESRPGANRVFEYC